MNATILVWTNQPHLNPWFHALTYVSSLRGVAPYTRSKSSSMLSGWVLRFDGWDCFVFSWTEMWNMCWVVNPFSSNEQWEKQNLGYLSALLWGWYYPVMWGLHHQPWNTWIPMKNNQYPMEIRPFIFPEIPTTIKTMGVNITTIAYLRVLIIEMGSTIIFMAVEAQGFVLLKWI